EILRGAWRGTPVRHERTHYRLDSVSFLPPPAQPSVPIWSATERVSGRPVRRAAALDGVFPVGLTARQLPMLLGNITRLRAGLNGAVIERGAVAAGTTGAGEGNILVSDKEPGPELELAQLSVRLWRRLGDELGPDAELEPKGGLVVAAGPEERRQLDDFAAAQAAAGVKVRTVGHAGLRDLEPYLADGLAGG